MRAAPEWEFRFPGGVELQQLLKLSRSSDIEDLLSKTLTEPLKNILSRPRKNLRAQLVEFGFIIARNHGATEVMAEPLLDQATTVLEMLHAGSLVIDDIQDGSTQRRGSPSMHLIYGVPVALNAGNWLYFLPFRIIEEMDLPETQKRVLARECQSTLLRAHYGQALDVGVPFDSVPQERISEVVSAAIELKTGALSALAFKMGAVAGSAPEALVESLETFGCRFGIALQKFDDIGNAVSEANPEKQLEDIKLKRLTFVVATAAENLSRGEYTRYLDLTSRAHSSPDAVRTYLISSGLITKAKEDATHYLESAVESLAREITMTAEELERLKGLQRKLVHAYD